MVLARFLKEPCLLIVIKVSPFYDEKSRSVKYFVFYVASERLIRICSVVFLTMFSSLLHFFHLFTLPSLSLESEKSDSMQSDTRESDGKMMAK